MSAESFELQRFNPSALALRLEEKASVETITFENFYRIHEDELLFIVKYFYINILYNKSISEQYVQNQVNELKTAISKILFENGYSSTFNNPNIINRFINYLLEKNW